MAASCNKFCLKSKYLRPFCAFMVTLSMAAFSMDSRAQTKAESGTAGFKYFCDQATLGALRMPLEMGIADGSFIEKSSNQFTLNVEDILKNLSAFTPWDMGLFPDKELRSKTFSNEVVGERSKMFMVDTVDVFYAALQAKDASAFDDVNAEQLSFSELRTRTETLGGQNVEKADFIKRLALCADVSVSSSLGCPSALAHILKWASPVAAHGTPITDLGTFEAVLTNPELIEGLRIAALKILTRFRNEDVSGRSNLFTDIKDSFLETGLSEKVATESTWRVLAVISSSGANLGQRLARIKVASEFNIMKVALSAIALSTPKLDFVSRGTGRLYSLPENIETTCENGKPYHFWMTGYYSRRLVQLGYSPKVAAIAAFIAQKGYEMIGASDDDDPDWALKTPTFSAWNNMKRVDMAYSSAGATFGAFANVSALSVDEGISILLKSASRSNGNESLSWSSNPALSYFAWKRKFAPDSTLFLNLGKVERR